jgi:hypothetical protein
MDLINCNVYVNNFPYEIYRTITSIKYIHTYMYINVFKNGQNKRDRQHNDQKKKDRQHNGQIKRTDNTMAKIKRTNGQTTI